jgi:hypothetical protein
MTNRTQNFPDDTARVHEPTKHPLVVRVTDNDFQCEVLSKLAGLEAKMEMLVGGGQPGRISVLENRVGLLERNDVRRGVYDRLVNAALTTAISLLIALHDRWWK